MTFRTALAGILLITACIAGYAGQDDKAPPPSAAKDDAKVDAKDKAAKEQPAPAAKNGADKSGAMVFIDPVTRQIRQPTEAEIAALATASTANANTAQTAPQPTLIQGPGGAVGLKLGADSLSYMVVTRTPDGKLVMDCVTEPVKESKQPPQR